MVKEYKRTITSIFMVPTLKIPKDALRNNGFINGFIKDDVAGKSEDNAIFLLFKPTQLDEFKEFLDNEYERTKHIVEDYDHKKGFVVIVYNLNDKYAYDFTLVKQGKYSLTSTEFQNEFPKTIQIIKNGLSREEVSLQYRVFNKTEDLVKFWEDKFGIDFPEDQEIWDGFQEENEILTEAKLREYEQQ